MNIVLDSVFFSMNLTAIRIAAQYQAYTPKLIVASFHSFFYFAAARLYLKSASIFLHVALGVFSTYLSVKISILIPADHFLNSHLRVLIIKNE